MTQGGHKHKEGRVARALLNYGMGSYLPQVINFLLVPLYTHYIAPAEMGAVEVSLTAQLLLIVVMRLGMGGSVTRYYFDHRDGPDFRDLVTTVAISMVVFSAALMGLGFLVLPSVCARYIPSVPFHPYIDLALVTAFVSAAPDLQRRLLQSREQSGISARLSIAFGVLTTVANLVLVTGFHLGGLGVLYANLIVSTAIAIVAVWMNVADLRGRFRLNHLRGALSYGLPLVPHHAAAWLQQFVGRWVLTVMTTSVAVGHVAAAAKIASPLGILTASFATAFAPVYFSWRHDLSADAALSEIRRIGRAITSLGGAAVIGAATMGPIVVRYTMSASYREAAPLVGVAALALYMHLLYTLAASEIFYCKRTKWVSIVFVTASAVNLGLVVVLAPRLGALGALIAQVIGGAISVGMISIFSSASFPLPLEGRPLVFSMAGAAMGVAFGFRRLSGSPVVDGSLNLIACATLALVAMYFSGALAQLRSDLQLVRRRRLTVAVPKEVA
jgi:O-antigen/teichoic acid export membrane protein